MKTPEQLLDGICRRWRRKGYGVHSPFAYDFITYVARRTVSDARFEAAVSDQNLFKEEMEMGRLLFRVVDHVRPALIVDGGDLLWAGICMRAASPNADYRCVTDKEPIPVDRPIGLIHLSLTAIPRNAADVWRACSGGLMDDVVVVMSGLHTTRYSDEFWEQFGNSFSMPVTTFDFGKVGVVFFDKQKQSQHYKV
ncbi:MAG: hypothetical protein LBM61_04585 [Prevotellaceae bacterium]|jgi:hypothetical protein|nr:hypothetical protein [Prevotellaceae bacterium]